MARPPSPVDHGLVAALGEQLGVGADRGDQRRCGTGRRDRSAEAPRRRRRAARRHPRRRPPAPRGRAAGRRSASLELSESLQQDLALANAWPSRRAFSLGLALGVRAQRALVLEQPQVAQGEGQDPAHSAQQAELLACGTAARCGERRPGAEGARPRAAPPPPGTRRRRARRAFASPRLATATRELGSGPRAVGEPDRGDHRPRREPTPRPRHRAPRRRARRPCWSPWSSVVEGRDQRQELRQLLGGRASLVAARADRRTAPSGCSDRRRSGSCQGASAVTPTGRRSSRPPVRPARGQRGPDLELRDRLAGWVYRSDGGGISSRTAGREAERGRRRRPGASRCAASACWTNRPSAASRRAGRRQVRAPIRPSSAKPLERWKRFTARRVVVAEVAGHRNGSARAPQVLLRPDHEVAAAALRERRVAAARPADAGDARVDVACPALATRACSSPATTTSSRRRSHRRSPSAGSAGSGGSAGCRRSARAGRSRAGRRG